MSLALDVLLRSSIQNKKKSHLTPDKSFAINRPMLNPELVVLLKTMKVTGDAARQLKVSRQWLIEIRHMANIPCMEIGGYFLWTPDQIELARQIIEKQK